MSMNTRPLRIFQVIPDGGTILSEKTKSSIWKKNLHEPLLQMGHDVVLLDAYYDDFFVHAENHLWLRERRKAFTKKIFDRFLQENKKKKFNLCFFYLCDEFIELDLIEKIRQQGVKVVNYSCNNIHQFHLVQKISRLVDYAIYTEREAKPLFAEVGANAVHMQMAGNPDLYFPQNRPSLYDVTFIGQRYADRGQTLTRLLKNGIDIKAFGPRWDKNGEKVGNHTKKDKLDKLFTILKKEGILSASKALASKVAEQKRMKAEDRLLAGHVGPILQDEEMIAVFSQSKINLGFSNVFQNGRDASKMNAHIRLRDFEIPMCQAFYLTGYTSEIEEYFEVGKEIEVYKDFDDLLEKCRFYLRHETARNKIARAGYERSVRCHTWEHRFRGLFSQLTLT